MKESIILATNLQGVYSHLGILPWDCPKDLKHFREKTLNQVIIMGSLTYSSLGRAPLPNRKNIIVSRSIKLSKIDKEQGVECYPTLQDAREAIFSDLDLDRKEIFYIGGKDIWEESLSFVDLIYWSLIFKESKGQTFNLFEKIKDFEEISREQFTCPRSNILGAFLTLKRIREEI